MARNRNTPKYNMGDAIIDNLYVAGTLEVNGLSRTNKIVSQPDYYVTSQEALLLVTTEANPVNIHIPDINLFGENTNYWEIEIQKIYGDNPVNIIFYDDTQGTNYSITQIGETTKIFAIYPYGYHSEKSGASIPTVANFTVPSSVSIQRGDPVYMSHRGVQKGYAPCQTGFYEEQYGGDGAYQGLVHLSGERFLWADRLSRQYLVDIQPGGNLGITDISFSLSNTKGGGRRLISLYDGTILAYAYIDNSSNYAKLDTYSVSSNSVSLINSINLTSSAVALLHADVIDSSHIIITWYDSTTYKIEGLVATIDNAGNISTSSTNTLVTRSSNDVVGLRVASVETGTYVLAYITSSAQLRMTRGNADNYTLSSVNFDIRVDNVSQTHNNALDMIKCNYHGLSGAIAYSAHNKLAFFHFDATRTGIRRADMFFVDTSNIVTEVALTEIDKDRYGITARTGAGISYLYVLSHVMGQWKVESTNVLETADKTAIAVNHNGCLLTAVRELTSGSYLTHLYAFSIQRNSHFVGFALNDAVTDEKVYTQLNGQFEFPGAIAGAEYFVQEDGSVSTTPTPFKVGIGTGEDTIFMTLQERNFS